jgi:wyosine [tRNA(Phe)-imidazoG37] synthetase (radical SAM superfamily)
MASREELQRFHPREYAEFTYAYPVLSRRSGGVSFGVNLNLDKACNFDCPYCQVDRTVSGRPQRLDVARVRAEVEALLDSVDAQGVCRLPLFDAVPDAQKMLRDIALSGDGEPTMVPEFAEIARALAEVQATRPDLDFKLVLISNATLLDRPGVRAGVDALFSNGSPRGEVWAKLDAGTEAWYQRVNVSRVPLDRIEANLISLGKDHPFKVQSFFCRLTDEALRGGGWDEAELTAWLSRLGRVRDSGARILEVQLYTLARRPAEAFIQPVDAAFLNGVRQRVEALGIPANVYGVAD